MLYPWFVQQLSVDEHLRCIPALDEVHSDLLFSFQAGRPSTRWNVWPFSNAAIEVDRDTSTEVTKGDVVDAMHAK